MTEVIKKPAAIVMLSFFLFTWVIAEAIPCGENVPIAENLTACFNYKDQSNEKSPDCGNDNGEHSTFSCPCPCHVPMAMGGLLPLFSLMAKPFQGVDFFHRLYILPSTIFHPPIV